MSYPVPADEAMAEIEIKKSRFIAYAKGISSREEGMLWLETLKAKYPDARHHCWAYLIGNPKCAANAGMGDDGEPSGTAGKPILNVLNHKNVGDVMICVVRYFGGIKLGAGGLTRAYGQAAQAVMEVLSVEEQIPLMEVIVKCDFSQEQWVRHCCTQFEAQVIEVNYSSLVEMVLNVPEVALEEFQSLLEANRCEYKVEKK
ncbi:YigZ family protein [Thiomicrorhabdus indica]|uniref:YigZ family protein n=1 Tax=Thiomicrorhabdus indica TaxID=2267253 RepID=UPI00102DFD42|nr:YigZ family protein [Thiomicrorhabdus indica]